MQMIFLSCLKFGKQVNYENSLYANYFMFCKYYKRNVSVEIIWISPANVFDFDMFSVAMNALRQTNTQDICFIQIPNVNAQSVVNLSMYNVHQTSMFFHITNPFGLCYTTKNMHQIISDKRERKWTERTHTHNYTMEWNGF